MTKSTSTFQVVNNNSTIDNRYREMARFISQSEHNRPRDTSYRYLVRIERTL